MIWTIATWAVIAWGVLATLYMVGVALLSFPGRTVDDVVDFLRPVDLAQAELLLDPGADYELKLKLDAETLREVQRKRVHVYLELVRRMAHNARVLVEFGNREAVRRTGREAGVIAVLQREAVKVRLYSLLTILKLRVLLAVRPRQTPSLVKFRIAAEVDGISSYKGLREASTTAFAEFKRPVDKLILSF
jgi:hypothetical protein